MSTFPLALSQKLEGEGESCSCSICMIPTKETRLTVPNERCESVHLIQAGVAALRWLARGYAYEVSGADVWAAYSSTNRVNSAAFRVGGRVAAWRALTGDVSCPSTRATNP